MNRLRIKQYFTMAEFTNQAANPLEAASKNLSWNIFLPQPVPSLNDDQYLNTLLQQYIWPRYFGCYMAVQEQEVEPWQPQPQDIVLSTEKRNRIAGAIYAWLNESSRKYKKLIQLYEGIEEKLRSKLQSTSSTLFNDTPQAGGDFTADPYITNATKVATESDAATPIARLKEVQKNITNFYSEWADEFATFIFFSAED